MPYDKKHDLERGKWIVYNPETGRVMGEHDTEDQANDQLAALYINVPDARKAWIVSEDWPEWKS